MIKCNDLDWTSCFCNRCSQIRSEQRGVSCHQNQRDANTVETRQETLFATDADVANAEGSGCYANAKERISQLTGEITQELSGMPLDQKIKLMNFIKQELHEISPFKTEPVDCVLWVPADEVTANDYNPNSVAPPEMELLRVSIFEDGYTQPIVSWHRQSDQKYEVVDGFHRNRVGRECAEVEARIHGYLPLTVINDEKSDKSQRIASTIRHNRARGKHAVSAMSDIVVELKRRNWSEDKISRELGMDKDEILRLCQITGLAELFSDQEFSKSWDVEGHSTEDDFEELTDDVDEYGEVIKNTRTVNTSDENRVFHTYDKWECHKAGFYATTLPGLTKARGHEMYRDFLADLDAFEDGLKGVTSEWVHSCEHYLTNIAMNRIAWLGQAAMCYKTSVPAAYRGGFSLLTEEQQERANALALKYLNKWLKANGLQEVSMDEAAPDRQSEIY